MRFRLSTYLLISIVALVVISTTIVSGVLYLGLKENLTSEFKARIKAENGELGLILKSRLTMVETQLRSMTLDNTIRITLMLGADQQLEDYLSRVSPKENDLHVFITRKGTDSVFTASTLDIDIGKPRSDLGEHDYLKRLENDPKHGFRLVYVFPIYRQKGRIGSLIGIYFFGKDDVLFSFFGNSGSSQALILKDGALWNLMSGKQSLAIKNVDDNFRTDVDFSHIYFEKKRPNLQFPQRIAGTLSYRFAPGVEQKKPKDFLSGPSSSDVRYLPDDCDFSAAEQ